MLRFCDRRHRYGPHPIQLEYANHLRQIAGLVLQRIGSSGGFLHQCRVLLRDGVHLGDGLIDLIDTGFLFPAQRSECQGVELVRCRRGLIFDFANLVRLTGTRVSPINAFRESVTLV